MWNGSHLSLQGWESLSADFQLFLDLPFLLLESHSFLLRVECILSAAAGLCSQALYQPPAEENVCFILPNSLLHRSWHECTIKEQQIWGWNHHTILLEIYWSPLYGVFFNVGQQGRPKGSTKLALTSIKPKYTSLLTCMRESAYSVRDVNFISRRVCAYCTRTTGFCTGRKCAFTFFCSN